MDLLPRHNDKQAIIGILATDHDGFDSDLIKAHARLIVDTRGVYREPAHHIVKA
ncbi:hypothetical protein [uncultured Thiodictyon sp.]|uniref:hypothetical protein n=1 Tax=uncultured Thiodictyon sp. TaxID=1846217 RepID=UPI0025F93432|nr:hypothetical protein [uncultured Thiodictyon sp.]